MEDIWQPPEVIEELVALIQNEPETWAALVDRFREADELQKIGEKIVKRYDLEPQYFPERKTPMAPEIAASFLERRFGRKYKLLNSQLVMAAHQRVII